uniref:Uncharacterized protein n=1 Tax=Sphaerodactylus townsendi TaxID=933632 RepID=A0ACB8FZ78_9SAUR
MGKARKRRNWKARLPDESGPRDVPIQASVQLELGDEAALKGVDGSNALILPPRKTKGPKRAPEKRPEKKPLSKKRRKLLQKVVEQKEKKAKRADLLKKLSEVQAPEAEMKLLYTTSKLGMGKRMFQQKRTIQEVGASSLERIRSVGGANRKRNRLEPDAESEEDESSSEQEGDPEEQMGETTPVDPDVAPVPLQQPTEAFTDSPSVPKQIGPTSQPSLEPAVFIPVDRSPEIQVSSEHRCTSSPEPAWCSG